MSRTLSYEQYMNMVAEKVIDNSRQLRRGVNQRRNGMEDLYGVCFSANGDSGNPATFYISLSPDYIYLQRFAFKFVIRPFTTTVKGGTESSTVTVDDKSLSVNNNSISPNPHNHTTRPHTHNVINGMSFVNTTSKNWQIKIHGVDITPYLEEQQDTSPLFDGEGIYPTNRLDRVEDFYDILDVASVMYAEGNEENARKILAPEFKKVEIFSNAPFGVDAYLYMKFSNTNR